MTEPLMTVCSTCGVMTMGRTSWYKRSRQERADLKAQGILARRANQCIICFCREDRRGIETTPPYSGTRMDRESLLAEWRHFADPELSRAENCRRLAPRLGMRWRTLERSLMRAGVTGSAA